MFFSDFLVALRRSLAKILIIPLLIFFIHTVVNRANPFKGESHTVKLKKKIVFFLILLIRWRMVLHGCNTFLKWAKLRYCSYKTTSCGSFIFKDPLNPNLILEFRNSKQLTLCGRSNFYSFFICIKIHFAQTICPYVLY